MFEVTVKVWGIMQSVLKKKKKKKGCSGKDLHKKGFKSRMKERVSVLFCKSGHFSHCVQIIPVKDWVISKAVQVYMNPRAEPDLWGGANW